MGEPSAVVLLPSLLVFVLAMATRRPIESLIIAATLSASTFGSHACFYSDATVLTAQASGCTPFQHAITQIPFAMIAASVSIVGYLLLGYT